MAYPVSFTGSGQKANAGTSRTSEADCIIRLTDRLEKEQYPEFEIGTSRYGSTDDHDFRKRNEKRKCHVVHLSDTAFGIIIAQIGKNTEYVFTLRGKKINEVNTQAFRNAPKRAGISDYRFHDNRHTWASTLVQNGVSLYELQEMGAWQSAEMVKRYAHLAPRKLNCRKTRKSLQTCWKRLSQICHIAKKWDDFHV